MKYYIEYKNRWYDLKNLPNEEWLPISGFEGLYEISNFGRVKSLGNGITYKTQRIIKQLKNPCGYLKVDLSKNGKVKLFFVHRLVAIAFLENQENLPFVNHKDEDKQNNHVDNLECCSAKYNSNYGTAIDRMVKKQINHINKSKPVSQFTKTGEFIAEFPSTMEVERLYGYDCSSISKCCNGKIKTSYGYIWKYKKVE